MEIGLVVTSVAAANSVVAGGARWNVLVFTLQGFCAIEYYQVMYVLAIMAREGPRKFHCSYYDAVVGDVDALWVA